MTLKKLIDNIKNTLIKNNQELIDLQANMIVSYIMNIEYKYLDSFFDKEVNRADIDKVENLLLETQKKPIQLILGYTFVNNIFLYVNKDVLLPGTETSGFINIITALLIKNNNMTMVDLGAGSGVVSICIAKTVYHVKKIFAIDKSQKALNIVNKNLEFHNIENVQVIQGDWLEPLIKQKIKSIDLITANPPYVKSDNINRLSKIFIKNTPYLSVNGGSDGLIHFKKIINDAHKVLKTKGLLLLQTDEYQVDSIIDIINNTKKYNNIVVFSGTSSLPRFVLCEKNI